MSQSSIECIEADDDPIEIAITDFLKTRLSKNYSVFSVFIYERGEYDRYEINDNLIVISILPIKNSFPDYTPFYVNALGREVIPREYYITLTDTLGSKRLPTRHIIQKGKLFYWHDSEYGLTQEMVDAFINFNIAEKVNISDPYLLLGLEGYIDDAMKGADYYLCKNDLRHYKRVITNIATGWYKPPTVRCRR